MDAGCECSHHGMERDEDEIRDLFGLLPVERVGVAVHSC